MTKNITDLAIFQNYKHCQDTMIQNKQKLSGFHYSEKNNDKNITLTWIFFQCECPMKLCSLLLSAVSTADVAEW